jgi:hypothetical protein
MAGFDMLNENAEKKVNSAVRNYLMGLKPCSTPYVGITRIRFKGFDLRPSKTTPAIIFPIIIYV